MKIILLGAPGSGKGTQAENLQEVLHVPTISTGNILRAAIKAQNDIGLKAKVFIDAGQLVPDELVLEIIKVRLAEQDCEAGYILDGFPRTKPQAEALDNAGVKIDAVISIEVADEEIEQRLTGRRVCGVCGKPYHTVFSPPKLESVCDDCGGALIQRDDDNPATVRDRLRVYHQQTEPLKGFYENKGILRHVISHDEVKVTSQRTLDALQII